MKITTKEQLYSEKPILPLVKSACMIVTRNNSQGALELLFLKRNNNLSFSNMHVFPGGRCQLEDKQIAHSDDYYEYAKITAIRETFQETGLLYLPSQFDENSLLHLSEEQLIRKMGEVWSDGRLRRIKPIFRIMTIQWKSKRFDTIFYVPMEKYKIVNFKLFWQTKHNPDLQTLDKLVIDLKESESCVWKTPSQCLEKNGDTVMLSPPQIIILGCIKHVQTQAQLVKQLGIIQDVEPVLMMPYIMKNKGLCPRDKDYDVQTILKQEPASQSRNDLAKSLQKIQAQKKSNDLYRFQMSSWGIFNLQITAGPCSLMHLYKAQSSI